eukprot:GILI01013105.1.p1 GENE.GILI01013105.1~~GILI01013105.1.p1  ORF type:complete len:203 (-),score=33.85 GILI01013105.1:77-685(-)
MEVEEEEEAESEEPGEVSTRVEFSQAKAESGTGSVPEEAGEETGAEIRLKAEVEVELEGSEEARTAAELGEIDRLLCRYLLRALLLLRTEGSASVVTQEIAVHVISAGGGGSGVDNGGVIGGIEQLRAACAMVTTVPASGVANRIMRKVSGGAVKDEPQEEDGEREVPTSGGDNADLIRPYLVGVGNGEFLAPCRLTVSKVK